MIDINGLWTRWMSFKYLAKFNFWVLPINNSFSGTVKSILRQHDMEAKIMTRLIINGEHTDLWYDPWINHKSLVD